MPSGSVGEIPVWESPTVIGFYALSKGSLVIGRGSTPRGLPTVKKYTAVNVLCFTKLPPLPPLFFAATDKGSRIVTGPFKGTGPFRGPGPWRCLKHLILDHFRLSSRLGCLS